MTYIARMHHCSKTVTVHLLRNTLYTHMQSQVRDLLLCRDDKIPRFRAIPYICSSCHMGTRWLEA